MTRATTTQDVRRLTPAAVLLRRRGLLYVPAPTGEPTVPDPLVAAGVTLLEADLLALGVLMSAELRHRLERLDPDTLALRGRILLSDAAASLGADRRMQPLFRGFPHSTPPDGRVAVVGFHSRVEALLDQRDVAGAARLLATRPRRAGPPPGRAAHPRPGRRRRRRRGPATSRPQRRPRRPAGRARRAPACWPRSARSGSGPPRHQPPPRRPGPAPCRPR